MQRQSFRLIPSTARFFEPTTTSTTATLQACSRLLGTSAIMSSPKYKAGQKVEYHPIGGRSGTSTSTGTITRVLTEPDAAGSTGVTVKASLHDPRYEIENDNTGKRSAVKEDNIERTI
ncbi:hypothetical protein HOY82DRAFT_563644, partial [Tuber indicum]